MSPGPKAAALILLVCGALTACGRDGSATAARTPAPTTARSSPARLGIDLAARMRAASASVHSAQVTLHLGEVGATPPPSDAEDDDGVTYDVSLRGAEQLSEGSPTAMDLSGQLGVPADLRVIRAADVFYVDYTGDVDRPWVVASRDSGSELGRTLAPQLEQYRQVMSPERWATLLASASDVRPAGTDRIDGTEVVGYRFTLTQPTAPSTAIPTQVWLDRSGRFRRAREDLTRGAINMELVVTLGGFDAPVDVSAPPPAQIRQD
jgi:hypothetical protein